MSRRYWAVLGSQRKLAVASVSLSALSGLSQAVGLAVLVPLFQQLGHVAGQGPFTRVLEVFGFHGRALAWAALVAFVLLGLVSMGCKFAASATVAVLRARLEAHLRKDLTERLLGMEWSAFVMMRFGEIANSLIMESAQVGTGVQQFLIVLGSTFVTLTFVAMALLLSVRLTLVVVVFAIVSLVLLRPLRRRAERYTEGLTEATRGIARQVADVLGNLKFFRSTGSRGAAQTLFSRQYDEYASWLARTMITPVAAQLIYQLTALVFVAALLAVSLGTSTFSATTLVFLAIFWRLSPSVSDLQTGTVTARVQLPWLLLWEQRREAASAHPARLGGTAKPTFSDRLFVDRVSFTFPETTRGVLDEISWEVGPGEAVAFVGESGAGKSTMIDLVTGLLAPTDGRILIDGVSLADVDIEAWQSHIGLVLQDSPLFHATVRENVAGARDIDDERIWECLSSAHAKAFVQALPDRLDTVIGERGGRISGGERQRLGLARALYRRPWLLILDEATNQLDSLSEHVILEALKGLKGRVSMLISAHRLATIEMADRIYVLDQGRIVQIGSWAELLADQDGAFANMAAKQGLMMPAAS